VEPDREEPPLERLAEELPVEDRDPELPEEAELRFAVLDCEEAWPPPEL
jgi:hypothetical protein